MKRHERIVLLAILLLALCLRLKGITNPLLDHPGWRQGDEAAIARNFARVDANPLHPQADYNGPGPNYIELELQIVPYTASLLDRLFGVHEIFGRLISLAASLGLVGVVYAFGAWLYRSTIAGLCAATLIAIAPGAIFYGRTFQPDTLMTLLLTAALFMGIRTLVDEPPESWRGITSSTLLLLGALLAKSVAVVAIVPLCALAVARFGWVGAIRRPQHGVLLLGAVLPFCFYDRYERAIASWRWASGIVEHHVIPELLAACTSPHAFIHKLVLTAQALTMLAHTMLGPVLFALLFLGFIAPRRSRTPVILWSWLLGNLLYLWIVVTVEQVDYYLYPFLPLAALVGGGFLTTLIERTRWSIRATPARVLIGLGFALGGFVTIAEARSEIAPYYIYHPAVLHQARLLNQILAPNALVVVGHLDPSVQYYIDRRGWEEDPYLWSVFDEQSAIAKGARYFVVVEPERLKRNIELAAWLRRFPILHYPGLHWTVYQTDPAQTLPNAEATWHAFRIDERLHRNLPETSIRSAEPIMKPLSTPTPQHDDGFFWGQKK